MRTLQVTSSVHGKARVGFTGVFLSQIQGKGKKGTRGGRKGSKKAQSKAFNATVDAAEGY